jgi:hypothetical protein
LKQWECVLVGHHSNVGRTIEEFESREYTDKKLEGKRNMRVIAYLHGFYNRFRIVRSWIFIAANRKATVNTMRARMSTAIR